MRASADNPPFCEVCGTQTILVKHPMGYDKVTGNRILATIAKCPQKGGFIRKLFPHPTYEFYYGEWNSAD